MARRFHRLWLWTRRVLAASTLIILIFSGFAIYTMGSGRTVSLYSDALREERTYRIYFEGSDRIIYSLDGNIDRNAWAAATFYLIGAMARGDAPPTLIAVHSNSNRDRDFRNEVSTPKPWRPNIEGRARAFDAFLLSELREDVEKASPDVRQRTLSGFSLSGLYALDLASRKPDAFDHIQAFSPTISHDTSIVSRLPKLCDGEREAFVSWGLESNRDTEVFLDAMEDWRNSPECYPKGPTVRRHFGIIHAVIMITGHAERAFSI